MQVQKGNATATAGKERQGRPHVRGAWGVCAVWRTGYGLDGLTWRSIAQCGDDTLVAREGVEKRRTCDM